MRVTNLIKTDSLISWLIPGRHISVRVQKKENYLDVTIKADTQQKFIWPKVNAPNYMLPFAEGKYIPANDPSWQAFLKDQTEKFLEFFSMPFFALDKAHYTILYIVKNPFNNQVRFTAAPAVGFSIIHDFTSIDKEKTYGFRVYVTDTDPVTASMVYKQYVKEQGRFKTLKEKALENPNVRKLYGAPQIYLWTYGAIAKNDINWKSLNASLAAHEQFFKWVSQVMKIYGQNDAATELNEVYQQCKTRGITTDYQKRAIVRALNMALTFPKLYNPNLFSYHDQSSNVESLSEQKVYAFNKKFLKSILKNAIDAPDHWGKENVDMLSDMYQSGIKKAWICFPDWGDGLMNPAIVERASQLGYLVAPYDSYNSIQQKEDWTWRSTWFPDSTLYNNATITNASGKKISGFLGRGRQLNPTLSMPSVKQRVAAILSDQIPYNSWFVDCDAFGEVFDDYTPGHITTEKEDFKARNNRMEYIGKEVKMVIGSEQGNDFSANAIAFAQGMEMPVFNWDDPDLRENTNSPYYLGGYWSPSGGIPPIYSKVVPIKPVYRDIYINPQFSLPLFRLVYNDAVITTAHWESGSLKIKNEVGTRMLAELLYNTPPLYHLDQATWKLNKKLIVKYIKTWSALHQKAVHLPMTGFNTLTSNRMVQQTVFGKVLKVTVNFSKTDATIGRKTIPGRCAIIENNAQKSIFSVKQITD